MTFYRKRAFLKKSFIKISVVNFSALKINIRLHLNVPLPVTFTMRHHLMREVLILALRLHKCQLCLRKVYFKGSEKHWIELTNTRIKNSMLTGLNRLRLHT